MKKLFLAVLSVGLFANAMQFAAQEQNTTWNYTKKFAVDTWSSLKTSAQIFKANPGAIIALQANNIGSFVVPGLAFGLANMWINNKVNKNLTKTNSQLFNFFAGFIIGGGASTLAPKELMWDNHVGKFFNGLIKNVFLFPSLVNKKDAITNKALFNTNDQTNVTTINEAYFESLAIGNKDVTNKTVQALFVASIVSMLAKYPKILEYLPSWIPAPRPA